MHQDRPHDAMEVFMCAQSYQAKHSDQILYDMIRHGGTGHIRRDSSIGSCMFRTETCSSHIETLRLLQIMQGVVYRSFAGTRHIVMTLPIKSYMRQLDVFIQV